MSFQSTPEPPRKRRFPRPDGRWTNPASPLQAARFARRLTGKQLVAAIRQICPGHAGKPCRLDVSKASDYETGNRRPGIEHIEAFCRFYQKSPEDLGLIKWRDEPTDQSEDTDTTEDSTDDPDDTEDSTDDSIDDTEANSDRCQARLELIISIRPGPGTSLSITEQD